MDVWRVIVGMFAKRTVLGIVKLDRALRSADPSPAESQAKMRQEGYVLAYVSPPQNLLQSLPTHF